MTRKECVNYLVPILKSYGFCKEKNRWHKRCGDVVIYLDITGSNYGSDLYYSDIYLAVDGFKGSQDWQVEHRIQSSPMEQRNVSPVLILSVLVEYCENYTTAEKIKAKFKADKNFQHGFLYTEFRKFCEN